MDTKKTMEPTTEKTPTRRNWWVAAAAAGVIVVGAALLAILPDQSPDGDVAQPTPTTSPASPEPFSVQIMESFAPALAANDYEAASEFVNAQVWDDRHRNLLGYWETLGAHRELTGCALSDDMGAEVSCQATMNGAHYQPDPTGTERHIVQDGQVMTPIEYENQVDLDLYDYAAAQDPAGAEEACAVGADEADSVFVASNGLAYKPSCAGFLSGHVDGWTLDTFEHFPVAEPEGSLRVDGFHSPFYVRHIPGEEWTVVFFYRPPECIPESFNLTRFLHEAVGDEEGAVACGPPTVDGYQIWSGEPGPEEQLISDELTSDRMPVWVYATPQFEEIMADGTVTIGELEAADHREGVATDFQEVTRVDFNGGSTSMEGTLDDGTTFTALQKGEGGAPQIVYVNLD